uniref:SOCS box domain-containing protein n=1 Tax=Denticeps clupeoides TaxID=299321 RepID=A0AAY4E2N2_9TELE
MGSRAEVAERLKARFLRALQEDNAGEVLEILRTTNFDTDTVLDVEDRDMILASYKQGYWLPGHKLESSWAMGIHVCMMYDSLECAQVLLQRGAAINRKPNGKTPLHVACEVSRADCVALLLEHGARVNSLSLSGHTPLHYCVTKESLHCAKQLILKGADVKWLNNNDEDTPLHAASRFGVPELVGLYASNGANLDAVNSRQETPLITAAFWAYCTRSQTFSTEHHLVCRMLLDCGAQPDLHEEDHKTALHKAAWNCDHTLMEMLLVAGANPRNMDVNGCSPIQYVVKVSEVRHFAAPEICFQLLLNHGAPRIYPPQFHKVLQSCRESPKAIEVMVNSYEHLKPTRKWRPAVPDATYEDFYDSLFAVCGNTPRTLMHLARCAVRAQMFDRCHAGVEKLAVPPSLRGYLLLEPEGILY